MIDKLKSNYFIRHIMIMLLKCLSYINIVCPKDDHRILFFDSGRNFLDDNSEALFTYFVKNGFTNKYKIKVCVPKQDKRDDSLAYKPIGAFKGVLEYIRSKYVFFSFGDFRIQPSSKQIVINQWHGTPLKKIGKYTDDVNYQKEKLDNFTYILASSESYIPIMAKAFGCSTDKVLVYGNCRNDYMFKHKESLKKLGLDRAKYNKVIIWMPTFRQSNDSRFRDGNINVTETMMPILETAKQIEGFDSYLESKKVFMIIKVHPMAVFKINDLKNVKTLTNDDLRNYGIKLYELIGNTDALITDYSSVMCDYLLLDRPIAFTMDDYDLYEKNRGFILNNLRQYLPGEKVYDYNDFTTFIENLVSGIDNYKDDRIRMCKFFNKYTDGSSCERITELVGIKK